MKNNITHTNQDQFKKNLEEPYDRKRGKQTIILWDKGISISVGKGSDVGMVRTLNEDSLVTFDLTSILQSVSKPFGFYMIADGMGGHEAGEEASKLAIEYITKEIIDKFKNGVDRSEIQTKQIIEEAVFNANEEIYKTARIRNNNMGTTITLAFIDNLSAFILNVGDARTYHLTSGKLTLITHDHSLVYRLYKMGQLTYEEIFQHPYSHQILCALGDPNLQKSLNNMATRTNHHYFFNLTMNKGDGLLLCSDGLWQMISEQEIEQILNIYQQPQQAVDELIKVANQKGGDDNISVIFVRIL